MQLSLNQYFNVTHTVSKKYIFQSGVRLKVLDCEVKCHQWAQMFSVFTDYRTPTSFQA